MKREKLKRMHQDDIDNSIKHNWMGIPISYLDTSWSDLESMKLLNKSDNRVLKTVIEFSKKFMDRIEEMDERGVSLIYYGDNIHVITSILSRMIMDRYHWYDGDMYMIPTYCQIDGLMNRCHDFATDRYKITDEEYEYIEKITNTRFLIIDGIIREKLYNSSLARMRLLSILDERREKKLITILGVYEDIEKSTKILKTTMYHPLFVPGNNICRVNNIFNELMEGNIDGKNKRSTKKKAQAKEKREDRG